LPAHIQACSLRGNKHAQTLYNVIRFAYDRDDFVLRNKRVDNREGKLIYPSKRAKREAEWKAREAKRKAKAQLTEGQQLLKEFEANADSQSAT
jgi:hypothetical protein